MEPSSPWTTRETFSVVEMFSFATGLSGIDVINPAVPKVTQTFAVIERTLRDALNAMGGDHPPTRR